MLKSLTLQRELAETWRELDKEAEVTVLPTIEDTIDLIREIDGREEAGVEIFVTGSFHLVGGVLSLLDGQS